MKPVADELARFAAAVAARLGLRVDLERAGVVIERRAACHRESNAAYLDRLETAGPAELRALGGELTVGETYFLRHIEQLRAFAEVAAPDRLAHGQLRVLSAGCSSGEEPYTLAMLLSESHAGAAFTVHGIDLNAAAIARARAGRYSRWSLRATTPAFEHRWFRPVGRDALVVPEIRAAVTFEQANLFDDSELASPGRWDVVFCRNVLMYFTDDQAAVLLARITRALAPGGYLFLGHADTLRGHASDLALCHSHGAFYYQLHPVTPAGRPARAPATTDLAAAVARADDAAWYDDIHAAAQRVHSMVDDALDQTPAPAAASRAPSTATRAPSTATRAPSTATRAPVAASRAPATASRAPAPPAELAAIRELLAQDRFSDALERLERLRAASGDDRDVAMLHALVLTHAGRFEDARAACTALLAIDATSAGANYLLSLCSDSTGDTHGAVRLAQLAAELDPSFAMPRMHLGLIARRAGDRAIASRELTRAITLLEGEAPSRLALYGSGFSRQALLGMCRAELAAMEAAP